MSFILLDPMVTCSVKGLSINDVSNWEGGGGVKNWSKLQTDSTKWGCHGGGRYKKSGKFDNVVFMDGPIQKSKCLKNE